MIMSLPAALLLLLLAAPAAYAVQYTVGDSSGWTSGGDYSTWAQGKTFNVGDTLLFNYGSSHSVDEVSKSDYDSCSSANPIKSHTGGSTVITLSNSGPMYFLCPTAGHCAGGMKLAITVEGGSTPSTPTTPSPPSTTPSGSPPTTGTTPTSPPPPSGSGAASIMNGGGLMLGFSLLLGAVFAVMC